MSRGSRSIRSGRPVHKVFRRVAPLVLILALLSPTPAAAKRERHRHHHRTGAACIDTKTGGAYFYSMQDPRSGGASPCPSRGG